MFADVEEPAVEMSQGSLKTSRKVSKASVTRKINEITGAFHYAKDSGNFGRNSNGKVRFGFFWPEYSGSPLEVVHMFRSEYANRNSPFRSVPFRWQSGSLP